MVFLSSGGGNVRIENAKLDFKDKAHAKVGSLSNVSHTPGGGNVMVRKRLTYVPGDRCPDPSLVSRRLRTTS